MSEKHRLALDFDRKEIRFSNKSHTNVPCVSVPAQPQVDAPVDSKAAGTPAAWTTPQGRPPQCSRDAGRTFVLFKPIWRARACAQQAEGSPPWWPGSKPANSGSANHPACHKSMPARDCIAQAFPLVYPVMILPLTELELKSTDGPHSGWQDINVDPNSLLQNGRPQPVPLRMRSFKMSSSQISQSTMALPEQWKQSTSPRALLL